jgi:hypothetical protein
VLQKFSLLQAVLVSVLCDHIPDLILMPLMKGRGFIVVDDTGNASLASVLGNV